MSELIENITSKEDLEKAKEQYNLLSNMIKTYRGGVKIKEVY